MTTSVWVFGFRTHLKGGTRLGFLTDQQRLLLQMFFLLFPVVVVSKFPCCLLSKSPFSIASGSGASANVKFDTTTHTYREKGEKETQKQRARKNKKKHTSTSGKREKEEGKRRVQYVYTYFTTFFINFLLSKCHRK